MLQEYCGCTAYLDCPFKVTILCCRNTVVAQRILTVPLKLLSCVAGILWIVRISRKYEEEVNYGQANQFRHPFRDLFNPILPVQGCILPCLV
jgi:hypothetical protein